MKFFSTDASHPLSRELAKATSLQHETFTFRRYDNQEMYLSDCPSVLGENVVLFGSFTPPDTSLFQTLLAAHTLKKEGASRVHLVLPFAAYMRHDKQKPGLGMTTAWVGAMIQASSIDSVLTVDIHSEKDRSLVPVEITSLSPATIFAEEITKKGWTDATLIAPDNGAIPRCRAVSDALQSPQPIAHFTKERTTEGVTTVGPIGAVTRRCILIDDQLDTGATLLRACEQLQKNGVEEILVMVTHGLFTGDAWKALRGLGVQEIITTDSLVSRTNESWVSSRSLLPILEQALHEYGNER